MLKRWAAWPPGIRWLAVIAAVVLAAAIVWALFVPLPDWLARHDVGLAKPALLQTARDAVRGRLLTLAAGLFAAGALAFTALNFSLSRRTFELTEQGQVTDRFTKAIEQLGSDKLDVRIGGIYALERIARDSAKDHPTVMEVLTAFIREHSREPWPPPDTGNPDQRRLTRPDVQAAVTVVSRRDAKRDIQPIGLGGADLAGADLTRANLRGANLRGANLTRADLTRAALDDADLTRANLARANLDGADLANATLFEAHLDGANLTNANLTRTPLFDANLTRADLDDANLTRADLTGADLRGAAAGLGLPRRPAADLTGAALTGADLTGADLTGARLDRARWPTAEPVPEGWRTDESGRLERAGQLSEVTAHYL
jgi:uncharacterized protein YjbI with pentapeptide repeats